MPHTLTLTVTACAFLICTAVLIYQAAYSIYFRTYIAQPHGFYEGIMTGVSYLLFLISYGLLAIQFILFIAFRPTSEIALCVRVILFALTVVAFFIFRALNPSLLAIWFGKSVFWDSRGENGKNLLSDIYGAKVHKKKSSHVINNQQLYKISFYIKDKYFLRLPKKYTCKLTAKQITALTEVVDFKAQEKRALPLKNLIRAILLPTFAFLIIVSCFFHIASLGVFNSTKYSNGEMPYGHEVNALTPVTDVFASDGKIFVCFADIGAVNIYSSDGNFLYSISTPSSLFKSTDFAFADGELLYRYGGELMHYSANGYFIRTEQYTGEHDELFKNASSGLNAQGIVYDAIEVRLGDKVIASRPCSALLFNNEFLWPITMLLIIAAFMTKYLTEDKKTTSESN